MIRLLADENFNNDILRGIHRRNPKVDIVRVQDIDLSGAEDPTLLEWAAVENRKILTPDVSTMTHYAHERVRNGKPMGGVIELPRQVPLGAAIDDILMLVECSLPGEWDGQVLYLPWR